MGDFPDKNFLGEGPLKKSLEGDSLKDGSLKGDFLKLFGAPSTRFLEGKLFRGSLD